MNPSRQYKQLTLGQRYQIEALIGKGHAQKVIAETVGISEGALSRELRVNRREGVYRADIAHTLTMQRRKTARKHKKSDERHMPIIEKGLLLGWSPEKISLRMKIEYLKLLSAIPPCTSVLRPIKRAEARFIKNCLALAKSVVKVENAKLGVL